MYNGRAVQVGVDVERKPMEHLYDHNSSQSGTTQRLMRDGLNFTERVNQIRADLIPGLSVKKYLSKEEYEIGVITELYSHFALCKAVSDNYNFSVTYKDLALENAEVI